MDLQGCKQQGIKGNEAEVHEHFGLKSLVILTHRELRRLPPDVVIPRLGLQYSQADYTHTALAAA